MNTAKFQIDLNEKFETLRNAPIVEAVIRFNAVPTVTYGPTELKDALASRFPGYTLQDQRRVETGLERSADDEIAMHREPTWDGFRLRSEGGKEICQWKRDSIVFSRLQPYESWPRLLESVMPLWSAYRELGRPEVIEGIGVRFISQMPLHENEKLSKYVHKIPKPLPGLGLRSDSFFHQDTIPLKGYPYELKLIRAMQAAAEKSGSKKLLIVDIDVSTTMAVTFDQLAKTLDELRYIKNKVFFSYMKNAVQHFG